jgi:hypothetical protein
MTADGCRRTHCLLARRHHAGREPPVSSHPGDRYLADVGLTDVERNTAQTAVRAIGYHREPRADAALDQIARVPTVMPTCVVRRQVPWADQRGAAGVAALSLLIDAEKNVDAPGGSS